MVQIMVGLHEDEGARSREALEAFRLWRVARQRLLAEHVLPRAQRRLRPLVVCSVNQRNVHSIDLIAGEDLLVRAVE